MPVTNVRSGWDEGKLVFRDRASADPILELDGPAKVVVSPVHPTVHHTRQRFTTAQVNAGATILPAIPGYKYRMVDASLIAIGGSASGADSVDIIGTLSSPRKLMAGLEAGLTENTLLRAGAATNGVILAAGASFTANDANTAITIGKSGSNLATATHVDVLLSYAIEPA